MSGLDISSGGAIEVDPSALRDAAAEVDGANTTLSGARGELARAGILLRGVAFDALDAHVRAQNLARDAEALTAEALRIAAALRQSADTYELLELMIERDALAARGGDLTAIDAAIARSSVAHPDAAGAASAMLAGHGGGDEAIGQLQWIAFLGFGVGFGAPVGAVAAQLAEFVRTARASGRGRIPAGAAVAGDVGPVQVQRLSTTAAAAPRNLSDALGRIPQGDGAARVRVERYEMPDGTRRFSVYITGTRALAGQEVFDGPADVQLFGGEDAASLATVEAALEASGAQPGETVQAYGYSQGGMIADYLAASGVYEVDVLATAGSPTSYEADAATLSVELRHADDPVAALADGGFAQRVGAEGSFVAERIADPQARVADLELVSHHLTAYLETAGMVDDSGDPRVGALQERLAALSQATRVTAYEYAPILPGGTVLAPGVSAPRASAEDAV